MLDLSSWVTAADRRARISMPRVFRAPRTCQVLLAWSHDPIRSSIGAIHCVSDLQILPRIKYFPVFRGYQYWALENARQLSQPNTIYCNAWVSHLDNVGRDPFLRVLLYALVWLHLRMPYTIHHHLTLLKIETFYHGKSIRCAQHINAGLGNWMETTIEFVAEVSVAPSL